MNAFEYKKINSIINYSIMLCYCGASGDRNNEQNQKKNPDPILSWLFRVAHFYSFKSSDGSNREWLCSSL